MDITTITLHIGFVVWSLLGVALVAKFSKRDRSHISFIVAMLVSIVVTLLATIISMGGVASLSFYSLVGGVLMLVSLCYYALLVVDPNLIGLKWRVGSLVPLLLSVAVYVGYHISLAQPLNVVYSIDELLVMSRSVGVILRFVIAVMLLLTTICVCWRLWQLISQYQNKSRNIIWLRRFVVGIVAILISYLIMVCYNTTLTTVAYMVVTAITFTFVIDNVIKHCVILRSTVDERVVVEAEVETKADRDSLNGFYEWIESDKPYLSSDFAASVAVEKFPSLSYLYLEEQLQRDGYSFQSYIRRCRIEEAVRLMEERRDISYKEIASMVGFKHYSSFCRAFVAVKGVSPKKL